jgi:hypothetical protein
LVVLSQSETHEKSSVSAYMASTPVALLVACRIELE